MKNARGPASLRQLTAILLAAAVADLPGCRSKQPLTSGMDLAGMDNSVAPGDDFNAYCNGKWIRSTPIPADKPSYGIFTILADETRKRTQTLIQELIQAGSSANDDNRKIAAFYSSFMDDTAIESSGIALLKPQLDRIAAITDRRDLARVLGGELRADVDPLNNTSFETDRLFGLWVTQGLQDPSHSVPYLLQGGLGMPDRDYYVSASSHMAELRKQYQAHITATLRLVGYQDSAVRAARVFALETKMASTHATRVESEDVHRVVSWSRDELVAKAPGLDWLALLQAAGLNDVPVFMIWHPKAIPQLSALAAVEPIETWKDWLRFHVIERAGSFLPKAFVDERFSFHGKALSGIPELRPRWERGVDFTNAALGDAVARLYVNRYFPPKTKAKVQAMVKDLVKVFGKRIDALTWMSAATKAKAKQKLATLRVGVGYPDRRPDYSGLEIVKGDVLGNFQRAELFEYRRQLTKLHQPVDRDEWWILPQTVNALNLPLQNALNFPAAILQAPYFDENADAAHNYGSIGTVIGHEISHSFDDQGSQFDASGRLANWWRQEDFDHFKATGEALAAQFDTYRPFPDLAVNGHQTLSENIADVAGLMAAFDAYLLSLGGKPDVSKDRFSGNQRFFISFGQSWRSSIRDAALRREIATDGHAPQRYRADTVRNLDAWYSAFSVQSGENLYLAPKDRVRIW